ncbi:MAG: outer membrane protein heavy metal efflux system [Acidobacteriota bacterium]|jgi:cobalt-zinc-cadmium efflux system outer membrane protein|nr:outer membrane protein heavy metal efflux system [Acidobacteriota bacterium]
MHRIRGLAGLVLLMALPANAQQQPVVLTLEAALARARQSAPAVVAARMRIEEARARIAGASLRFSRNPTLEVEAGHRGGATSSSDYGVATGQELDWPQGRRARVDAATAAATQEEQRARDVEYDALRAVATAFLRAVEARERGQAAESGKRLADEALHIAERRYAAGDVAQLDVNLARTAVARSQAELRAASATLLGFVTELQVLLGMTAPPAIAGSLGDALTVATDDLAARAADRPDVRLLDAEIAEAEADRRLARTLRWPELGVRASYSKEADDRVLLGGVTLSLPLFDRGRQAATVAEARLARLRAQRNALTRTIEAEVRGAAQTVNALRAAADEYQRTVLPLLDENERLALESYEVGQIGLGDLLLVRREALDARRAFLDQLIETRLAEVGLRTRAGAWPGVSK